METIPPLAQQTTFTKSEKLRVEAEIETNTLIAEAFECAESVESRRRPATYIAELIAFHCS